MADEKAAVELVQFLRISADTKLKIVAIEHMKGLTRNATGISFILKHKDILEAIFSLLKDTVPAVTDVAYHSVINLSADDIAMERIIEDYDIITDVVTTICDSKSRNADDASKILNNLTRTRKGALDFLKKYLKSEKDDVLSIKNTNLENLLNNFCKVRYNENGDSLDHIASIFANITQTEKGRKLVLNHDDAVISRLLPFLNPDSSLVRRRGISMTIKNCCFEDEHHEWLLREDVEILPKLLLPLAGGEEFDEDENDPLPLDLQYLPEDKIRDPDPEIRRTILESLYLLCADEFGRKLLKDSGTYYIIRELHLWENKNGPEENGRHCENLVQVLIADEPEPGKENLMKVPDDGKIKFLNLNKDFNK